jgi:hypothetical protein
MEPKDPKDAPHDEPASDEAAEAGSQKRRKLVLTKRVVKHFDVRSGVQAGWDDPDTCNNSTYRSGSYFA